MWERRENRPFFGWLQVYKLRRHSLQIKTANLVFMIAEEEQEEEYELTPDILDQLFSNTRSVRSTITSRLCQLSMNHTSIHCAYFCCSSGAEEKTQTSVFDPSAQKHTTEVDQSQSDGTYLNECFNTSSNTSKYSSILDLQYCVTCCFVVVLLCVCPPCSSKLPPKQV